MKSIIVTDTHLGYKKASDLYHDIVCNLFEKIRETAIERHIKTFIHLGDFFDNRKHISLKTLEKAVHIGDLLSETFDESYILIGNHDTHTKNSLYPTSLSVFSNHENIYLIDMPTVIGNIRLFPWLIEAHHLKFLQECPEKIVMGHFEMNGIKLGVSGNMSEKHSLSLSDFSRFDKVLSGHFHLKGSYGNIEYIGNPYHMNFNDGGDRGFYIFDDETLEMEFIKFEGYPKFISYVARIDDVLFDGEFTGDIIRLIFKEDFGITENTRIVEKIKNMNPVGLFIRYDFSSNKEGSDSVLDVKMDSLEMIHQHYIDGCIFPENINKSLLKSILEKIYKELDDGN